LDCNFYNAAVFGFLFLSEIAEASKLGCRCPMEPPSLEVWSHSSGQTMDTHDFPDLMTVSEVADYLRVRERTIYELVRTQRIPSCKLSGKLLFPKRLIELWVAQSADYPQATVHLSAPPPVIAGSHDLLLEWSVRESNCDLAILVGGSTAGLHRLLAGQAVACGRHLTDPESGEYDASALTRTWPGLVFVVIEWARRLQGLVVASGNPLKIGSIADLRKRR